jgi:hypothetical protein
MLTTIQEIYFDLTDLIEENEEQLAEIKINGFSEFENLLEFIREQRDKMSDLEDCVRG